jgi:hypothetical protein
MASEEEHTQVEEDDFECTQEGTSFIKTQWELEAEYSLFKGNFKEFTVLFTPMGKTEATFLCAHVDDAQRTHGSVASTCDARTPAENARKKGMPGKSFGLTLCNSRLELQVFNSFP